MIEYLKKKYWDFNNLSRAESGFYIAFPILGLTLVWFSFYNASLLMTDIDNLLLVENKVISKNINRNLLTIRLNNNSSEFFTDNLSVNKELGIGDVVKIYYKNRIIANNIKKILQLEKDDSILIVFSDVKKNSFKLVILCAILGFTFLGFLVYYKLRIKGNA